MKLHSPKAALLIFGTPVILIAVIVGVNWYQTVRDEISQVDYKVAQGELTETYISSLKTLKAQDYAKTALEEYEQTKDAYPAPVVTILSPYELNDDGTYIINTGSGDVSYTLQFTAQTPGEELGDVLENVPVITSTTATLQVANRSYEGVYSYTVDLSSKENDATLTGGNKYKVVTLNLQITREESEDEKALRLKMEQADREWEQSAAGQICTKHPDWSDYACEELADDKIWIGMTLDMLKYLRGNPSSTNVSNYGTGNSYQYCWYRSTPMCFYDEDGDGAMDSYN